MYVIEKRITRGEGTWDSPLKVYSYWQLVRSYRDPDSGKVKKQVVAHIGKADDKGHAERLARSQGLMCSILGCGREWGVSEEAQPSKSPVTGRKFRRVWRFCQEHYDERERGKTLYGFAYMPGLYGDGSGSKPA